MKPNFSKSGALSRFYPPFCPFVHVIPLCVKCFVPPALQIIRGHKLELVENFLSKLCNSHKAVQQDFLIKIFLISAFEFPLKIKRRTLWWPGGGGNRFWFWFS